MPKNEFAKRLSKKRRESGVLTQKWTAQGFIDAIVLVLCDEDVMGDRVVDGKEAIRLAGKIFDVSFEVRHGLTMREDADATRVQVDRKLAELLEPEDWLPWSERYADWYEESLDEELQKRRYRGK